MADFIQTEVKDNIAYLILAREDKHNAFNAKMIEEIIAGVSNFENNKSIRALVIKAAGKNFSAGADLNWMQEQANNDFDANYQDAQNLAKLMQCINDFSRPTIACVCGSTYGGGNGIIAACDIAIASIDAKFCFSEAKLGLIPAVIGPYIVNTCNTNWTKKLFLTAEVFDANLALQIGLVHKIVPLSDLKQALNHELKNILNNGPMALQTIKQMLNEISSLKQPKSLMNYSAELIAKVRASNEAKKGINAFLNKEKINWQ